MGDRRVEEHGRPSRRRVAAGVAWSVPTIVVAGAAPAMATSGCPDVSITGQVASATRDRITISDTGTVAIPAGATITWVIQNVSASAQAFVMGTLTGVSVVGSVPATIGGNASATITLVTTAAINVGGSANWLFGINLFTYNSRVTLSYAGTSLAACTSASGCVSDRTNTMGTICPTSPIALPGAAKADAPASGRPRLI